MPQCLIGHYGPEVGTAYPDIDDVAHGFAGVASPFAATDAVGEVSHLVQHGMNLRDYVLTVHDNRRSPRGAQGHVQDSSLFGDIDLLAAEHRVASSGNTSFSGERDQQSNRLISDAVLREVQIDARTPGAEVRASFWIVGEELPQMSVFDFFVVRPQRDPRGTLS